MPGESGSRGKLSFDSLLDFITIAIMSKTGLFLHALAFAAVLACGSFKSRAATNAPAAMVEIPKSLFISIAALSQVPDAQVRSWFEHIMKHHRAPGSPQRINSLVLTTIGLTDPAAEDAGGALLLASPPPGADSRGYSSAGGNRKLDIVAKYFECFDSIYVGTMNLKWKGATGTKYNAGIQDAEFRRRNIQVSTNLMDRFMATYPGLQFQWYISYEANLNYFTDTRIKDGYVAFNSELCREMKKRRDAAILWSPNFWTRSKLLTDQNRAVLAANLKDHFSRASISEVHFQDHRGGSSHYTASRKFTAEDTKYYYDLLKSLGGPEIAVNVEMFVRKIARGKQTTVAMSHADYVKHMEEYAKYRLPLGASWEIRYWYPAHWNPAMCGADHPPRGPAR